MFAHRMVSAKELAILL